MSVRDLFNPLFIIGARTCEKSPAVAKLVRNFDFKGKGSVIQRIRSQAMPHEVTAECDGILYRLDLRDDVQREIYFNRYEQADLTAALSLIPAGGVCIDVGANIGVFALHMAQKAGASGVVHAFEPDPYVFSRLLHNSQLNHFEDRVYSHNVAVTDRTGQIPFYQSDRTHSGWGSLVRFGDIAVHTNSVEGTTLDRFLANEKIAKVDLIKIDVEAHEPELLQGASESLSRGVFRFVLIEFNGIRLSERGKTLNDFLNPLQTRGYRPTKLRLPLLKKMQEGAVPPETVCTNFLFAAES